MDWRWEGVGGRLRGVEWMGRERDVRRMVKGRRLGRYMMMA